MKTLSLTILLLMAVCTCFAQTIKGKIISSTNKQPIPYATVKLKLSNKVTSTNSNGDFSIEKDEKILIDTILVSNIGYYSLSIATNKVPKNEVIILKEDEKTLREININASKKKYKMLNEFSYNNALYSIEKDTAQRFISSKFPIAKLFTAEVDSFRLEAIHVGRYLETIIPTARLRTNIGTFTQYPTRSLFYDLKRHVKRAIFNLYIIYPDTLGAPSPLSQAIKIPVDVNSSEAELEIDLRNHNIRPKQRSFYIAIEWLAIVPNQNYSLGVPKIDRIYRQVAWPTAKNGKMDGAAPIALVYELGFEPFVSTYKTQIENLHQKYAWINNNWMVIEPIIDAKTDEEMALSAKISYYQP